MVSSLRRIFELAVSLPRVALEALRLWWIGQRQAEDYYRCAAQAVELNNPYPAECVWIVSEVMWDEVWQRPQELARRLSRESVVVYISPVQLHRYLFSLRNRWRPFRAEGSCLVLSPLIFPLHYRFAPIYALNCVMMAWLLRWWLPKSLRVRVVCNSPFAWPFLTRLFFRSGKRSPNLARLLYDVIDDFPSFEWAPSYARALEEQFLTKADVVTTGTYELWNMHRVQRPDAEFIQCGVDFELFNRPAGPMPEDLAGLPQPMIGYWGSISDRLDFRLLEKLARQLPQASLVLIGPVRTSLPLPHAPNIYYLGLKPHEELPRYAQHFSVGLIPFLVNEATEKLNPVKTLEYLAAGIPVVSTELPDIVRFFSHAVIVARDADDFIAKVREAIESPDLDRIRAGIAMAQNASWDYLAKRFATRLFGSDSATMAVSAEGVQGGEQ
ncbi:MAG: glycosyltransferase [Candidatus Sumerlaea chitinivorans]|nr:glycosyltransferase [Candidatus Sumerlaea chitinivorans]